MTFRSSLGILALHWVVILFTSLAAVGTADGQENIFDNEPSIAHEDAASEKTNGSTAEPAPRPSIREPGEADGATHAAPAPNAAIPDKKLRQAKLSELREVFAAEFDDRTAAGRAAFAAKLVQHAADSAQASDPAMRFVLLNEARERGALAGDFQTALRAIDALSKSYRVDAPSMKVEALAAAARARPRPSARPFAEACLDVSREVLALALAAASSNPEPTKAAHKQVALAVEAAKVVESAATVVKDPGFKAAARLQSEEARRLQLAWMRLRAAFDQLESGSGSDDFHLTAGWFACFVCGEWEAGLPRLAKGSDPRLKSLAKADMAGAKGSAALDSLGGRWWDYAHTPEAKADGSERLARVRAAHWYRLALPQLTGLANMRAKKRVEEGAGSYLVDLPPLEVQTGAWGGVKKGVMGAENGNNKVIFNGVHSPNGFGTHPPSGGSAHVAFQIDKRFKRLQAAVALNDTADPRTSPVTFRVVGDGKVLWRSEPVDAPHIRQSFLVDVQRVSKLELFVDCAGPFFGNHAIWIEPLALPW